MSVIKTVSATIVETAFGFFGASCMALAVLSDKKSLELGDVIVFTDTELLSPVVLTLLGVVAILIAMGLKLSHLITLKAKDREIAAITARYNNLIDSNDYKRYEKYVESFGSRLKDELTISATRKDMVDAPRAEVGRRI